MINTYRNTAHITNLIYNPFNEKVDQIEFFKKFASSLNGNILELGCGYGRVLIPIAKMGKAITGVDHSPQMLKELKKNLNETTKAERDLIKLVEGDFRNIELNQRFDFIFSCDRTFLSLNNKNDRQRAIRSVHKHLNPSGVFIFDSIDITGSRINEVIGQKIHVWTNRFENQEVKKFTKILVYNKKKGTINFHNIYEITNENGGIDILSDELLMFVGEKERIIELVEGEKFKIEKIIEGYESRPKDLIFVCKPYS